MKLDQKLLRRWCKSLTLLFFSGFRNSVPESIGAEMATAKKRTGKRAGTATPTPNPGEPLSAKNSPGLPSRTDAPEFHRGNSNHPPFSEVERREKIALLAYSYWVQRGRRGGSPEDDWYRAEREIALSLSQLGEPGRN